MILHLKKTKKLEIKLIEYFKSSNDYGDIRYFTVLIIIKNISKLMKQKCVIVEYKLIYQKKGYIIKK